MYPKDIVSEFFLSNRRVELSIQDCKQAGTFSGKAPKVPSLAKGLANFFAKLSSGCITIAGSASAAIWKQSGYYYSFTPGTSLMRFENEESLIQKILTLGYEDSEYEITSVDIVNWNKWPPWKYDPSAAVRPSNLPPLNAYYRLPGKFYAFCKISFFIS